MNENYKHKNCEEVDGVSVVEYSFFCFLKNKKHKEKGKGSDVIFICQDKRGA